MRSGSVRSRGHVRIDPVLYPALARLVARLGRRGEVLAGMWAGKGMKEIGTDMGVSPKTVEFHRAQLYRLFGVGNPVSLCRRAMVLGLIKPDVPVRADGPRHVRD